MCSCTLHVLDLLFASHEPCEEMLLSRRQMRKPKVWSGGMLEVTRPGPESSGQHCTPRSAATQPAALLPLSVESLAMGE